MKTLSETRILFKNVLKLKKLGFYCPTDSPLLLPKLSTNSIRVERSDEDDEDEDDDDEDDDDRKCQRIG